MRRTYWVWCKNGVLNVHFERNVKSGSVIASVGEENWVRYLHSETARGCNRGFLGTVHEGAEANRHGNGLSDPQRQVRVQNSRTALLCAFQSDLCSDAISGSSQTWARQSCYSWAVDRSKSTNGPIWSLHSQSPDNRDWMDSELSVTFTGVCLCQLEVLLQMMKVRFAKIKESELS